jgi:hypothetical protein
VPLLAVLTDQFCFLFRSWYNTANVDARAQNPNLRFQELKLSVIPRPKPLQTQSQQREKEAVRTLSFRNAKPARGRENTWYSTSAVFSCPEKKRVGGQDTAGIRLRNVKRSSRMR